MSICVHLHESVLEINFKSLERFVNPAYVYVRLKGNTLQAIELAICCFVNFTKICILSSVSEEKYSVNCSC